MPSGKIIGKLPPCRQPEYVKAYRKKRYREKRDILLAYQREWQRNNRNKMRDYDAKWREANPKLAKEVDRKKGKKCYERRYKDPKVREAAVRRTAAWQKANPEKHRLNAANVSGRRRARKLNTSVGPIDYNRLVEESKGICGVCKEPIGDIIHFDHIVPLSRGGTHTQDNLQVTHPTCNLHKNAKLMSELDVTLG